MSYRVAMALVGGLGYFGLLVLLGRFLRFRRQTTTYPVKGTRRDTH